MVRKLQILMLSDYEHVCISVGTDKRKSSIVLSPEQASHLAHRLMSYTAGGAAPYTREEWEEADS